MKGRMQKIPMSIDSRPQKDSTACESYEGVQTFMDMTENNLKELRNRRMPNGTYGGVRGRKTKVGRKLLRFPPTRFCGPMPALCWCWA